MKPTQLNLGLLILVWISLGACNENNPQPVNEEELVTTLKLTFAGAGTAGATFVFKDADGVGGEAPSQHEAIVLEKGKTYSLTLQVLDESDPAAAADITAEVLEEAEDHQFFFTASPAGLLTHAYADTDGNGLPVGIANTVTTSASAGTGTFKVTLKHQPGLKTGTSGIGTGETDVEVEFDLSVN